MRLRLVVRRVVQMRDRPAQRRDRHVPVHALEDVRAADRPIASWSPVHRERHARARPPTSRSRSTAPCRRRSARWLLFIASVIRSPMPLKLQHARRRSPSARARVSCSSSSNSWPAVWPSELYATRTVISPAPPDLEQRLVVARERVVAAGIDDAGEPEAIELAEELLRAVDLLSQRRPAAAGRTARRSRCCRRVIAPVGLPVASRSSLPPAGRSASLVMSSASRGQRRVSIAQP